jgi:hypothetical protein
MLLTFVAARVYVQQVQPRRRSLSRALLHLGMPPWVSTPPQRAQSAVLHELRRRQLPAAGGRYMQVPPSPITDPLTCLFFLSSVLFSFFSTPLLQYHHVTWFISPAPNLAARARQARFLSGAASAGTTGLPMGCPFPSKPTAAPAATIRRLHRTTARGGKALARRRCWALC